MTNKKQSRRKFRYDLGMAGISVPLLPAYSQCSNENSNKIKMKTGKDGIALVSLGGCWSLCDTGQVLHNRSFYNF